jgi:hypothetical protein
LTREAKEACADERHAGALREGDCARLHKKKTKNANGHREPGLELTLPSSQS